jgi:hypothetical protein
MICLVDVSACTCPSSGWSLTKEYIMADSVKDVPVCGIENTMFSMKIVTNINNID